MQTTIQTAILLVAIALFVAAAYGDIRTLRIPNLLTATVAALGVLRLVVIGDPTAALYTVGAAVLILFLTFLLFARGLVGGGDVKLLVATALLIGYGDLFPFLFAMSLFGGLVSFVLLIIRRFKTGFPVPYGVAIAGAGCATLLSQFSFFG